MAAIAWPEGDPSKYEYNDLGGYGIEELDQEEEIQGNAESDESANRESEELAKEDAAIEAYLKEHGLEVTNKSVMEVLKTHDILVQSAQVTAVKERLKAAK